ISAIGAIWLGRWHVTQLLNKIAATSLLNVGVGPAVGSAVMLTPAAIAMTKTAVPRANSADLILGSFYVVSFYVLYVLLVGSHPNAHPPGRQGIRRERLCCV